MKRLGLAAGVVLGCLVMSVMAAAGPITTGSLLGEMTDLKLLAEYPEVTGKTVQFSSYDRRSKVFGTALWFANSDGFGGEPIPNFEKVLAAPDAGGVGEYLICEVEGPGAMVRVWTAAISGTVVVYLDGAAVFEGAAEEFFMYPYRRFAREAGIEEEVFAGTYQQNNVCYFPMPFARGCRVVWKGNLNEIHFYQIQVRRYDKGAEVKTFAAGDLKTYEKELRRTAEILRNPKAMPAVSAQKAQAIAKEIAPGAVQELAVLEGPGAVERLTLRVAAADRDLALRQTVLRICFDYDYWGQVQSPIGDFFGAGPGVNPYDSLPFTVEPDGTMTCRFVMPYARSCRILAENKGGQAVQVAGEVLPMAYVWKEGRSMHFWAKWRADHELTAGPPMRGSQDMVYVIANGAGRYVGSAAMLLNPCNVPTEGGSWWGEGDEKIYIDDDAFPSTFGTGSEDYYNYAWSLPDILIHPYYAQPRNDGPANRGFVVNNRWHILDSLLFASHIAFYMELACHMPNVTGFSYARMSYLYGRPGLRDDHLPITGEDVRALVLPANWLPFGRGGSEGGVFFQAEEVLAEKTEEVSFGADRLWAGDRILRWQPQAADGTLAFALEFPEAGRYRVCAVMELSEQSGKAGITLDDKAIGFMDEEGGIDLFVPHRVLSRNFSSGDFEVAKGRHVLKFHNKSAALDKHIGIDFIWIQRR